MEIIGNVEKDAQVRAVASGALSTGDTVIVNSDGTVSVVGETSTPITQNVGTAATFSNDGATVKNISSAYDTASGKLVISYKDDTDGSGKAIVGTVSGETITFGSEVTFQADTTSETKTVFDAASGKIVIAYRNDAATDDGRIIVGTVSGTSISFGTPVTFESTNATSLSLVYDSAAEKVVILYKDNGNSDYGTAIVGAVSGTSISIGTPVIFESASTDTIASTYDDASGKIIVAYRDVPNSNSGTAIVGTVSGTSISFGSPTVFEANNLAYIDATYDSANSKVVIVYRDDFNNSYGTAIVGTVSGTSISFGSPVVFHSTITNWINCGYNVQAQKVLISYANQSNSNYGTAVVGTVSGASISFDTPVVFETGRTDWTSITYDPDSVRMAISYLADTPRLGNVVIFRNAYTQITSNLTAENFLGFAAHTYADTQSALVNSTCTVDRNQTGLTAGQTYYVQTDGSLGTTAADPSVVAGTAISSTEIIVKG